MNRHCPYAHCGCCAYQAGLGLALGQVVVVAGVDTVVNHKDMEVWISSEI